MLKILKFIDLVSQNNFCPNVFSLQCYSSPVEFDYRVLSLKSCVAEGKRNQIAEFPLL